MVYLRDMYIVCILYIRVDELKVLRALVLTLCIADSWYGIRT